MMSNLIFALRRPTSKCNRYFYILEHDAAESVARFADLGFRYVIALGQQGAANLLKCRDSHGVSKQTSFHIRLRFGVGHSDRDARLRLALADMEPLPKHRAGDDIISEGLLRGESVAVIRRGC